jgi:hypothetical protein
VRRWDPWTLKCSTVFSTTSEPPVRTDRKNFVEPRHERFTLGWLI